MPYVDMPERLVPGEPLQFATTLSLAGYGRGMLARSIDGRPIKIEGNPRHPASLGATDVFAEAAIMSLYDPDRSKAPRHEDDIVELGGVCRRAARADRARAAAPGRRSRAGQRPRHLADAAAPARRIAQAVPAGALVPLRARRRRRRARRQPAGLRQAAHCRCRASPMPAVVLALDADPLGPGPRQIARRAPLPSGAGARPRRSCGSMPWSPTGRSPAPMPTTGWRLQPALVRNVALTIVASLRGEAAGAELPPHAARFAHAVAADLKANPGRALVLVGERQPAEVHALAHWINAQLNAPVDFIEPVDTHPQSHAQSLQALAQDLDGGKVDTLIIIDANPAYDTPAALGFAEKIGKVGFSAHLGLHDDETAALCQWHLPLSHALESWSDLRAFDGTASIVQPLIRPLYDSRSAHDLVAMIGGDVAPSSYDLVRADLAAAGAGHRFRTLVAAGAA